MLQGTNINLALVLLLQLVNNHNNYYTFYNANKTSNTNIINSIVFCFKCSHWQYYKFHSESTKYAVQFFQDKADHLAQHKHARANDLKKQPIQRGEINTISNCDPILENHPYRGIFKFWVMHISIYHKTFPPFLFLFHVRTSNPSRDISKNTCKTSKHKFWEKAIFNYSIYARSRLIGHAQCCLKWRMLQNWVPLKTENGHFGYSRIPYKLYISWG